MRGHSTLVVAVAIAGAAAACLGMMGACSDDGGAIALDDFARETDRRACEQAVACGAAADQASCLASLAVADGQRIPTLVAAVKRGTITYDARRAGECLRARYPTDCLAVHGDGESACGLVFHGKVASAGACAHSAECADGAICASAPACADACCFGTCTPATRPGFQTPVALGGACSTGSTECVAGAYCAPPGICTARVGAGSACDGPGACVPPSHCNTLTGLGPATCVVPPGLGETCSLGDALPCGRTDNYCDPVTLKCTKDRRPGEPCSGSECADYAYCPNGTCQAVPTAGQACDTLTNPVCFGSTVCTANVCTLPTPAEACVPPQR